MPRTGTGLQTIICQRCAKPFQVWLSQSDRKFCSRACQITPPEERFWAKVDKSGGPDSCWLWTGYRNQDGYGNFPWNKEQRAHRISWIIANGSIPEGMSVLHHPTKCNNPPCVNPVHLYLGTQLQNVRDMISVGNKWSAQGESHANSLLNTESVVEIRMTYNTVPVESIATKFQITVATVRDVAKGRSWQSVEPKNYWDAQGVRRKTRQDNVTNLNL